MAKTVALGTILKYDTTVVGAVVTISPPGPEKPEIDVTDLSSVAHEYLLGLPDNGELSLSGFFNYADAGQLKLLTDAVSPTSVSKVVVIEFTAQAMKFTFNGLLKSFVPTVPGPNDAYGFDATIRVTGAITVAALP